MDVRYVPEPAMETCLFNIRWSRIAKTLLHLSLLSLTK
jgi:hypothetical protein